MAINKGLTGGTTMQAEDEAAADDNRLSLNPNDERWSEDLSGLADGGEATLTLRVRQVSPGEFQVLDMDACEPGEGNEEATEEVQTERPDVGAGGAPMHQATRGLTNPAIVAMMGRNK